MRLMRPTTKDGGVHVTKSSQRYQWWQKGLSIGLSWAMVMATTPVSALANDSEEQWPEPYICEIVDDDAEDDLDVVDVVEEETSDEEVVVSTEDTLDEEEPAAAEETVPAPEEQADELQAPAEDETIDEADAADDAEPELAEQSSNYIGELVTDGNWVSQYIAGSDVDAYNAATTNEQVSAALNTQIWGVRLSSAGTLGVDIRSTGASFHWWISKDDGSSVSVITAEDRVGVNGSDTLSANVAAGTYYVFVTADTTVGGTYDIRAYTAKRALTSCTFNGKASGSISSLSKKTYTGAAIKPAVTVKYQGATLINNVDYTVAYKSNKKVGTAKITITGKGLYSGSKVIKFKIVKRSIKKVKVSIPTKKWTGKAIKPNPTVKIGKTKLKKGTDYKIVKYENNKDAGTAKVTIKGKGGLTGTRTIKFKIRYDITKSNSVTGYYRPGTTTFTKFVYRKTGKTMKNKTDYKLSVYKNDSTEKVYKMVGKGKYMGTTYFTFYK